MKEQEGLLPCRYLEGGLMAGWKRRQDRRLENSGCGVVASEVTPGGFLEVSVEAVTPLGLASLLTATRLR